MQGGGEEDKERDAANPGWHISAVNFRYQRQFAIAAIQGHQSRTQISLCLPGCGRSGF